MPGEGYRGERYTPVVGKVRWRATGIIMKWRTLIDYLIAGTVCNEDWYKNDGIKINTNLYCIKSNQAVYC